MYEAAAASKEVSSKNEPLSEWKHTYVHIKVLPTYLCIIDARGVEFFRDFPCHWHPIADFDNTEFHVDVCDEPKSSRRKILRLLPIELDVKIFKGFVIKRKKFRKLAE